MRHFEFEIGNFFLLSKSLHRDNLKRKSPQVQGAQEENIELSAGGEKNRLQFQGKFLLPKRVVENASRNAFCSRNALVFPTDFYVNLMLVYVKVE